MWFIKGGVVGLLAVAATATETPEAPGFELNSTRDLGEQNCACEEFLKSNAWYILEKRFGYSFPEFCCEIGFWKLVYDLLIVYTDHGVKSESKLEKGAISAILNKADLTAGETTVGSDASNESKQNKLKNIMERFGSVGNTLVGEDEEKPLGEEENFGGSGYGYGDYCYGLSGYEYVVCQIVYNFEEAVNACYCDYRSSFLECTIKDCEDDDLFLDLHAVYYDPAEFCDQCPKKKEDVGQPEWDKPYQPPYRKKADGRPFEECAGFCFMTFYYRNYYLKHPYYYGIH